MNEQKKEIYKAIDYILSSINTFKEDFPIEIYHESQQCALLFASLAYFISRKTINIFINSLEKIDEKYTANDIKKEIMQSSNIICEYINNLSSYASGTIEDIN